MLPAGPASEGGYCVVDSAPFPVGIRLTVEEVPGPISYAVTSVVSPARTTGGRSIVATIGTGFTEVTFTNDLAINAGNPFNTDVYSIVLSAIALGTPFPETITVAGPPGVPFTAVASVSSGPAGWLRVSRPTGQTPATLLVSATGLPPGTYNGAITITSTDAANPLVSTIPVTYLVAAVGQSTPSVSMVQRAFTGGSGLTRRLLRQRWNVSDWSRSYH
jgi:hypothetical protein